MIGRVGVCSWSLQPNGPVSLAERLTSIGAKGVQVALGPLRAGDWKIEETRRVLDDAGISLLSGMMATQGEDYSTLDTIRVTGGVRPDAQWETNRGIAEGDARVAAELGLSLVTFHAGFIPHDEADPEREVLLERLRTVIDIFADQGVRVGFETGQETAATLEVALEQLDRPTAGVNFDPANMILYGMGDPIEAVSVLGSRIIQAHVKDANPAATLGNWGSEEPAGQGTVDWPSFFQEIERLPQTVDLLVEREAGENRDADIGSAIALIARLTAGGVTRG